MKIVLLNMNLSNPYSSNFFWNEQKSLEAKINKLEIDPLKGHMATLLLTWGWWPLRTQFEMLYFGWYSPPPCRGSHPPLTWIYPGSLTSFHVNINHGIYISCFSFQPDSKGDAGIFYLFVCLSNILYIL